MPQTDFETVSRSEAWHNSGLSDLEACERLWALANVFGLKGSAKLSTVAGTAYHVAMEFWDTVRVEAGEDLEALPTSENLLEVAMDSVRSQLLTADAGQLARYGGRAELDYQLTSAIHNWEHAIDTEFHLSIQEWMLAHEPVSLEGYARVSFVPEARDLAGTFDGLYKNLNSGELTLIDHKTAGSMSYWKRDANEKREQATHYSVLAALSPHLPCDVLPSVSYLVARRGVAKRKNSKFEGARILTIQPELSDVARLRDRVLAAEQTIEKGTFLPDPSYKFCPTCVFHDRCQGTGELAVSIPLLRTRLIGSSP